MAKKQLKGGTFNVLNGRDRKKVEREVVRLLEKHDLDFLCLQEANNYLREFNSIDGYDYIHDKSAWSGKEVTILVKSSLKQDRKRYIKYGDGWFRVTGGGKRGPVPGMMQVRVDGWLLVRSLHLPTPSHWDKDGLTDKTPHERKDDIIDGMKKLRRWFSWPCTKNARVAAGDWNEPPTTRGKFSPQWLMQKTGAYGVATKSRVGHGRIDWPMAKGARFSKVFKDLEIAEGSDHEPVIFTVTKT